LVEVGWVYRRRRLYSTQRFYAHAVSIIQDLLDFCAWKVLKLCVGDVSVCAGPDSTVHTSPVSQHLPCCSWLNYNKQKAIMKGVRVTSNSIKNSGIEMSGCSASYGHLICFTGKAKCSHSQVCHFCVATDNYLFPPLRRPASSNFLTTLQPRSFQSF
jgi:hypothetical protein